eukprot:168622_1
MIHSTKTILLNNVHIIHNYGYKPLNYHHLESNVFLSLTQTSRYLRLCALTASNDLIITVITHSNLNGVRRFILYIGDTVIEDPRTEMIKNGYQSISQLIKVTTK